MIACEPIAINAAQIVSTTVPANDHPLWVAGSYALNALVTHNDRNWKSTLDANSEEPGTGTQWNDEGIVSRYAPFDSESHTSVSSAAIIEYQIKVTDRLVNAIGFLNVIADSIQVIMTDDTEGVVYNQTYLFADYGADDIYDFFFDDYAKIDRAVDLDLPPYLGATLTIKINPSTDDGLASIGVMVLAQQKTLGGLKWSYSVGIEDYSLVERDAFGKVSVTQRGNADTLGLPVVIETAKIYAIKATFAKLLGRAILWVGAHDRPETIVFGYYAKFGCIVPNQVNANYQLDITGAI